MLSKVKDPTSDWHVPDTSEKTPVVSPEGVRRTGRILTPSHVEAIDEFHEISQNELERRIKEQESRVGSSLFSRRKRSVSMPSVRRPAERRNFLNRERLQLLHHMDEFKRLPHGEVTVASVWVGMVSCTIISVDQEFLNPFPSCAPVIMEIRRLGDKFQILDADVGLLDGAPADGKAWFEEIAREQLVFGPLEESKNGGQHWSDTIRRFNYSLLQHKLYFNAEIARDVHKGRHHFEAWIQSGMGILRDVAVPNSTNHDKVLLRSELFVDMDNNGFMAHFTDTHMLQKLHPNVLKFYEQALITVEYPPEFYADEVQDSLATPLVSPPLQMRERTTDVEKIEDISNQVKSLKVEGVKVDASVSTRRPIDVRPRTYGSGSRIGVVDNSMRTPIGVRAALPRKA